MNTSDIKEFLLGMENRFNSRMDQMDLKIDNLKDEMNNRFDKLEDRVAVLEEFHRDDFNKKGSSFLRD